jgi:lipid A disaccharide synthetase
MPELLQEGFTEEAVVSHLKPWLENESERANAAEKLRRTMELLESDGDAIGKIAALIEH